jgi:hypothetical protein
LVALTEVFYIVLLFHPELARPNPKRNLGSHCVNRTAFHVAVTAHRQALRCFPALHGTHPTPQKGSDLLPGIENFAVTFRFECQSEVISSHTEILPFMAHLGACLLWDVSVRDLAHFGALHPVFVGANFPEWGANLAQDDNAAPSRTWRQVANELTYEQDVAKLAALADELNRLLLEEERRKVSQRLGRKPNEKAAS